MLNRQDTLIRFLKFAVRRALSLWLVVIVGVFLTLLIASKSIVIESELDPNPSPIQGWFSGIAQPSIRYRAPDSRTQAAPVWETSLRLLVPALFLNFGDTGVSYSFRGTTFTTVRALLADALPRTLLLFGTANLLVFFSSLSAALAVTRRYGSRFEKLILGLSPLSTIPSWVFGVVIVVILARVFHVYQGGMLSAWPEEFSWDFLLTLLKHLGPAILAIFISKFFQSVYAWRSFLLIFSGEDYLELAKAKGLPPKVIERHYLLRPALPNIITSFTMLLIAIWQEAIVVELFFSVRGIGHVFYNAIRFRDMAVIVGLTITFAYLLALSVFLLDLVYGIVDPRVRMYQSSRVGRLVRRQSGWVSWLPILGRKYRHKTQELPGTAFPLPSRRLSPLLALHQFGIELWQSLRSLSHIFKPFWKEVSHYPSAAAGMFVILILLGVSIYTVIAIPYEKAVARWNYSPQTWQHNPAVGFPAWINIFRRSDLPTSIILDSRSGTALKKMEVLENGWRETTILFSFDYPYQEFAKSINLQLYPTFTHKAPHLSLLWRTPDGREVDFGDFSVSRPEKYNFSDNRRLARRLEGLPVQRGLFVAPGGDVEQALPGSYELVLTALHFEEDSTLEAEFFLEGRVYGWAGTDHRRRDISLALLWGAPVALAFGVLGAFGTTFTTMVVAGFSAWFGGWVDSLTQRLTEVSMILPVFPILLIIYNFYTKSFWVILGVAVLLGVFSGAIKTYRSIFLSVKESPYIEAARAYGAGDARIIFRYLTPRILPVVIPQLIILIPTYVYLEATLAFLNMGDPLLPTWGKLIREGLTQGGLDGAYHWLLLPAGILMLTGLAFLMVGYAFERVLNPRLRDH
jgi:peptide/nickel transport system permease protein